MLNFEGTFVMTRLYDLGRVFILHVHVKWWRSTVRSLPSGSGSSLSPLLCPCELSPRSSRDAPCVSPRRRTVRLSAQEFWELKVREVKRLTALCVFALRLICVSKRHDCELASCPVWWMPAAFTALSCCCWKCAGQRGIFIEAKTNIWPGIHSRTDCFQCAAN